MRRLGGDSFFQIILLQIQPGNPDSSFLSFPAPITIHLHGPSNDLLLDLPTYLLLGVGNEVHFIRYISHVMYVSIGLSFTPELCPLSDAP